MSKYGVFSGPYFPARRDTPYLSVFSPNAGKYGIEKTSYLDTIYAAITFLFLNDMQNFSLFIEIETQ